jgi:hypothetical protein
VRRKVERRPSTVGIARTDSVRKGNERNERRAATPHFLVFGTYSRWWLVVGGWTSPEPSRGTRHGKGDQVCMPGTSTITICVLAGAWCVTASLLKIIGPPSRQGMPELGIAQASGHLKDSFSAINTPARLQNLPRSNTTPDIKLRIPMGPSNSHTQLPRTTSHSAPSLLKVKDKHRNTEERLPTW